MNKSKVKKQMLEDLSSKIEEAKELPVGSEERKNAAEEIKSESEAYRNLYSSGSLDPNFLIKLAAVFTIGYLGMVYSETNILKTPVTDKLVKPILFLK